MIDRLDPSILVALAVALLGVIPGAWIWAAQSPGEPTTTAPASAEAPVPHVTVADVPIVVDELESSVSAVLQEHGFLGRVDSMQPELADLDPAIVAMLQAHDVVLQVAEQEVAP